MGYVFFLVGGAISWSSKQADIVTLSTTEAEYVALIHAAKEAIWLQKFFDELFSKYQVIDMLSANQGVIYVAKDDRFHQ